MKRVITLLLALLLIGAFTLTAAANSVIAYGNWRVSFAPGDDIAFYINECKLTDKDITLPTDFDGVRVIGINNNAFNNRTDLNSVTFSPNIIYVGKNAFYLCSSLTSVRLDASLTTIDDNAFDSTTSLTAINLQDTQVATIGNYAFFNSGVKEIVLPDTCLSLGEYSFGQCSQLKKVVIPESVTEIASTAFINCPELTIYCYPDSYAQQYAVSNNIPYVLLDSPVSKTFLLGDTDGDESVDVVDATWIQRYAAQMDVTPISATLMNGDVDDDGDPTVIDATFIMRYSVYIQTPYAIGELVTRA